MRPWTLAAAAALALVALAGPAAAADYMLPVLLEPTGTGGAPVMEPAPPPQGQTVRVDGLAASPLSIVLALVLAALTTAAFFVFAGRGSPARARRA